MIKLITEIRGSIASLRDDIEALDESLQRVLRGGDEIPDTARRAGSIAASTEEMFFNVTQALIVDTLIVSSDAVSPLDTLITLSARDKAGSYFARRSVANSGTGTGTASSFERIAQNLAPDLELVYEDTDLNRRAVRLLHPLIWPNGGLVMVRNNHASDACNIAAVVSYRLL